MSWLSKGLKKVRKSVGLPPLTLGTGVKVAGVSVATAVGGPAAGVAVAKTSGWVQRGKDLARSAVENAKVTIDPATGGVAIRTHASTTLPPGALREAAGDAFARLDVPSYYYAIGGAAAVLALVMLMRGGK